MRCTAYGLLLAVGCLVCAGCGSAKIGELTAEVERLKAAVADLEAKNAAMEAELTTSRQAVSEFDAIKQGYDEAREKFAAALKPLAPILGSGESPLPPFEGLKDSSWVAKLSSAAKLAPDVKALQNELKGLLGEGLTLPAPKSAP